METKICSCGQYFISDADDYECIDCKEIKNKRLKILEDSLKELKKHLQIIKNNLIKE